MVISKVGVLSCGKVGGAVYALLGLLVGICFALISMVGLGMAGASDEGGAGAGMFGAAFGVGAIILMPLFYGFAGFIGGIITAAIYNLVAGFVGGLELDVQ